MRRVYPLIAIGLLLAVSASCGGSSKDTEATGTPGATVVSTATSTPRSQVGLTPVAAGGTPSATATQASPTAMATATATATATTTPTAVPATPAPPTQPAATQAPLPTATPTTPPVSGNPASASVGVSEAGGFFWSPSSVAIAPGGSVTFSWSGGAAHNLTVPGLGFSGAISTSDSETLTFPSPGTYRFSCVVHPTTMNGTVTVQ